MTAATENRNLTVKTGNGNKHQQNMKKIQNKKKIKKKQTKNRKKENKLSYQVTAYGAAPTSSIACEVNGTVFFFINIISV